jgi:ribosomal protein S2
VEVIMSKLTKEGKALKTERRGKLKEFLGGVVDLRYETVA